MFCSTPHAMPLSPKLTASELEANFADIAPRYTDQQALGGIRPLPFLFRRALHHCLPDRHRYPGLHQKNHDRQRDRRRPHHPHRQRPRRELRARLPDRSPLRRRLRHARSRQRPDKNRPPPALRDRSRQRKTNLRSEAGREKIRQARRHHRRRPGRARLRGRTGAARARCRCFRAQTGSRRTQHLRHRLLQNEAGGQPRGGRAREVVRRGIPLRRGSGQGRPRAKNSSATSTPSSSASASAKASGFASRAKTCPRSSRPSLSSSKSTLEPLAPDSGRRARRGASAAATPRSTPPLRRGVSARAKSSSFTGAAKRTCRPTPLNTISPNATARPSSSITRRSK